MFSNNEPECVGFESIWRVKKIYAANSAQTDYSSQENATTTSMSVTTEVQTDMVPIPETCEVDMQRLSKWLNDIFPTVSKELNESIYSQAFKNYKTDKIIEQPVVKLLQALKVQQNNSEDDVCRVSALSWNSTGNTLAVACNYVHKIWCYHSGCVSLYTFDRYERFPEIPDKKLTTETCVTSVRFHPKLPSIIVAGTFTGSIVVWNIQHDDTESIICKINGHEETVTQISWISDLDVAKMLILATSSLDGLLTLWNFSTSEPVLDIKHKYKIKSPLLPKSSKLGVPEEITKKVDRGITTFDFSPYKKDIFIVGAEGGLVVQCSLLGTIPLRGSTPEVPISDPVYKYFPQNDAEITRVQFSPNQRDMFFTSANNGEIRIYTLDQDEPAQVIFVENPLSCTTWIPFHERILSGCGPKGIVEIFKLKTGCTVQVTNKDVADVNGMTQMELNSARVSTVAIGDDQGFLQVWNIPWSLFNCDY